MPDESMHVSELIDRTADEVYSFAVDPANLPRWASGLSGSIELVDGEWRAESPMGRIVVRFAPHNPFGVLDHTVTLADGQVFDNPMRVLRIGRDADRAEVVFTLRRQDGMSDEAFAEDAATIRRDLAELKRVLES